MYNVVALAHWSMKSWILACIQIQTTKKTDTWLSGRLETGDMIVHACNRRKTVGLWAREKCICFIFFYSEMCWHRTDGHALFSMEEQRHLIGEKGFSFLSDEQVRATLHFILSRWREKRSEANSMDMDTMSCFYHIAFALFFWQFSGA